MGSIESTDVLIVGAGIAGLAAASKLNSEGVRTIVLEKSRGVSGRSCTRRWDDTRVDNGAQFFSVRTPAFAEQVDRWLAEDVCFRWTKGFHKWADGELRPPESDDGFPRYACRNGMSALGKALADGVDVRCESRVTSIRQVESGWEVVTESGTQYRAARLIVAIPTPQALELLHEPLAGREEALLTELRSVTYDPCISVVLRCEAPVLDWKGIQLESSPLSWIGVDSSRRGDVQGIGVQTFVLHASGGFSSEWLDGDLEDASRRMIHAAKQVLGSWIGEHTDRMVHAWRYALVSGGFNETPYISSLHDPEVYIAGDSFLGARIEGAYNSGISVAQAILSRSLVGTD